MPLPRFRLDASPAALAALRDAASGLPFSPIASLAGVVQGMAGGLDVTEDPDLAPGAWELYADGQLLLAGTVTR